MIFFYFDYDNIFPQCTTYYNNATSESLYNNNTKIKNACETMVHMLGVNINKEIFVSECLVLSYFLNGIKSTENEKKIPCNYFNYKLKNVLRQCKCTYQDTETAYRHMNNAYNQENLQNYNICSNDLKNLKDDIFFNLSFLEWLYFYLDIYNGKKNDGSFQCPYGSFDYKKYLIFLSECKGNHSFCGIIKKLQTEKSDYMKFISKCLIDAKTLGVTSKINTIRVSVATFIVLFTILITVFVFYRYNFFGFYLQRRLRKIRNNWNNKNNENYILNDIFGMKYHDLIQDEYKIEYASKNY
ncbi:variable surface protein [Plasmodium gonderi]|uniref:Variable surface protein n=1 Tax=Plasmodium gonderi TaxID=77519 RepID=A0A1Y1JPU0_PLAGO|nr:variable surface protein [Plasmodium gonderi]GAW84469.1 variable surface protein [Plasmodium gonderi]